MASLCAGAPALYYGDVNTVTPSPGEVKGLIGEYESDTLFSFSLFPMLIKQLDISIRRYIRLFINGLTLIISS